MSKGIIGVIGGNKCSREIYRLAYEVGREIARRGYDSPQAAELLRPEVSLSAYFPER